MTWIEFRRQIAKAEYVPVSSIQLVDYDKGKFDFDLDISDLNQTKEKFEEMLKLKDPNILISNVYKDIVKY